jgi:hypothetical protein
MRTTMHKRKHKHIYSPVPLPTSLYLAYGACVLHHAPRQGHHAGATQDTQRRRAREVAQEAEEGREGIRGTE